jgi:hypothetical protein
MWFDILRESKLLRERVRSNINLRYKWKMDSLDLSLSHKETGLPIVFMLNGSRCNEDQCEALTD